MRWRWLGLWCVVALGWTYPGTAAAAEVRLVAIGNNLGLPGEVGLKYAERDATSIATVLQRLGGLRGEHTTLVLGEDAASIRRTLLRTNAAIRASGEDVVLIVYYSGHADARGLHPGESTLPYDELKSIVTGSPASMRLLIVDSCRSGGATRVKGMAPAPEFEIRVEERPAAEGMAIITSSAAGEDSQESDRLRASFFSHHLVTALRGAADKNRDGSVSLEEAYSYTYRQTLRSSGRTNQLQHPTYHFDIKGRGGLVLTRLVAERHSSGRLILDQAGTYLVIEGSESGPVVAEASVGAEGATLTLPPRRYFVQQRAARYYREYQLSLGAGDALRLADQDYETFAYARLLRKGGGEARAVHSVFLLGGARGELLDGQGVTPQLVLGYSMDLSWLTLAGRLRASAPTSYGVDPATSVDHNELGFGLVAQRFIDLPVVSVGLGLLVELAYHRQSFETRGVAPRRSTLGFGFGGLVTLQAKLSGALTLQLEGGPLSQVFRRDVVDAAGAVVDSETATPLTWWAAGGLLWRF